MDDAIAAAEKEAAAFAAQLTRKAEALRQAEERKETAERHAAEERQEAQLIRPGQVAENQAAAAKRPPAAVSSPAAAQPHTQESSDDNSSQQKLLRTQSQLAALFWSLTVAASGCALAGLYLQTSSGGRELDTALEPFKAWNVGMCYVAAAPVMQYHLTQPPKSRYSSNSVEEEVGPCEPCDQAKNIYGCFWHGDHVAQMVCLWAPFSSQTTGFFYRLPLDEHLQRRSFSFRVEVPVRLPDDAGVVLAASRFPFARIYEYSSFSEALAFQQGLSRGDAIPCWYAPEAASARTSDLIETGDARQWDLAATKRTFQVRLQEAPLFPPGTRRAVFDSLFAAQSFRLEQGAEAWLLLASVLLIGAAALRYFGRVVLLGQVLVLQSQGNEPRRGKGAQAKGGRPRRELL